MELNAALARTSQRPDPGVAIELFDLDATVLGGGVHHFTATSNVDKPLLWRGNSYQPWSVTSQGWEWNGRGTLPTPTIRFSNVNRFFSALVGQYDDLLGATVTRWRTFRHYLDDGASADPDAHYPVDVYKVERKALADNVMIEWELSAAMDQEGKTLPGRIVLREICGWKYRTWNNQAGAFDYSNVICPYVGDPQTSGPFFDLNGTEVFTPAEDRPSKLVGTCCKKRFGDNGLLPFGGFPGVARTRL